MKQIVTGQHGGSRPWWATIKCRECQKDIYSTENEPNEKTAIDQLLRLLKQGETNYCFKCGEKL